MKKQCLLSVFFMIVILAFVLTLSVAAEETFVGGTWGNISWLLNKGTGELVIEGEGDMESLVDSPAWLAYRDQIQTVVIQEGVTNIGLYAFSHCECLSSVTIPNSVTSIDYLSFWNCTSLTEITIPNTCTYISEDAFSRCGNITTATIPVDAIPALPGDNLERVTVTNGTSIPDNAFSGCRDLISVTFPDTITSIGYCAFYNCANLESIEIPDGVTHIGYHAFYNCRTLEVVDIPDTVTSMGDAVFHGCSNLRSVTFPAHLTRMGDYMFAFCESLVTVPISSNVTHIGDHAFYGCDSFTEVILPDSVISVSNFAFADCAGLKKLVIPNGIQYISGYAFSTTLHIETAVMPIFGIFYIPKDDLKTVIFTSGTSIQKNTFSNCQNLQTVIFCGTEEEWGSLQEDKSWLNTLRNTKFLYHNCQWNNKTDDQHAGTCVECGAEIRGAHTWDDGKTTQFPTHMNTGIYTYSCTVCNATKTSILPQTEAHKFENCTEYNEAQHTRACECGQIVYEDHDYGEWQTVKQVTEESDGEQQKSCLCGHKVTQTIPALNAQNEGGDNSGNTDNKGFGCNTTLKGEVVAIAGLALLMLGCLNKNTKRKTNRKNTR